MAEQLPQSVDKPHRHEEAVEKVELRQFACEPCHRSWWKRVHVKKLVSQCKNCRTKYDALPRDKEYGVAEFVCPKCGHTFKGRGRVATTSPCYRCHTECEVIRIVPGQSGVRRKKRRKNTGSDYKGQDNCPDMGSVVHCGEVPDSTASIASSFTERELEMRLLIDVSSTDDSEEEVNEEELASLCGATAERLPLTAGNLHRHDKLMEKKCSELMEDVEFRQFGCKRCYRSWWKRVRVWKPVSHCKICRTKYDALPRDKEFGIAEFVCLECGNTFLGRGRVTTTSPCFECGAKCEVIGIVLGRGKVAEFLCPTCGHAFRARGRMTATSTCYQCHTVCEVSGVELGQSSWRQNGVAEFVCLTCGHTFTARGQVMITSTCHHCHTECKAVPGQRDIARQKHYCSDCQGLGRCPNFRPVIHFSKKHDSTGDTASSVTETEFEVRLPINAAFSTTESIQEEDGESGEDT